MNGTVSSSTFDSIEVLNTTTLHGAVTANDDITMTDGDLFVNEVFQSYFDLTGATFTAADTIWQAVFDPGLLSSTWSRGGPEGGGNHQLTCLVGGTYEVSLRQITYTQAWGDPVSLKLRHNGILVLEVIGVNMTDRFSSDFMAGDILTLSYENVFYIEQIESTGILTLDYLATINTGRVTLSTITSPRFNIQRILTNVQADATGNTILVDAHQLLNVAHGGTMLFMLETSLYATSAGLYTLASHINGTTVSTRFVHLGVSDAGEHYPVSDTFFVDWLGPSGTYYITIDTNARCDSNDYVTLTVIEFPF